ncbi:hypothetical protein H9650_04915 [Psychrobacillus sp. Sa2BUA9]|uniref:Uncharacterized protein n=1 Tax=Psychrobacillus faecigallinarum TaxID=2762235 RepID=A0ABR8R720_9BACI|nr:hypothetical protein [Psychrobacillus faecigallinarum]MBD7943452.1 hypothetical protein [Psychrobacillus faecigallinarum]QGM29486.1 hypothetical protein GI482_03425 [Bacillus sp. N3536]
MLKKKRGKINGIIYNNTAYYKGKYRYYPTITDLKGILEEIISCNSTTNCLRVTPFYINEELNHQIEFEEYMFYIECRDWFDEKDQKMHILDCLDSVDTPRVLNDMNLGAILYPLCKHNDVVSYQKALKVYKDSLREILLKMMKIAKSEMKLKEKHLPFGYFCFEIQSD